MTTPHKATPEQWETVKETKGGCLSSCILELRDRLAAAEQRISELEGATADHIRDATEMVPAPAGGLVERLAEVITDDPADVHLWHDEARAAILAVAEWLDGSGYPSSAYWLREEANRHA